MDNSNNGLALRSLDDVERLAKIACTSGLVSLRPEQAAVILLTGHELGLSPMQSLRGIYVVNGKPVLSADMLVAVVRASGRCASWVVVESTEDRCTITTQRKGESATASRTWTMADAKRAGVTGKPIWSQYPRTMLRHRCAADLAREVYPDVVLGLYDPEELGADEHVEQETPAPVAPSRVVIEPDPAPPVDPEREAIEQETPAEVPAVLEDFYARVAEIELPGEAVPVWMKYRGDLAALPAPHGAHAWAAICKRTEEVGKMKKAHVWLAKAVKEEDGRRGVTQVAQS